MVENKCRVIDRAMLRQVARNAAKGQSPDITRFGPEDVACLVHEFGVYQIELETQNEELQTARNHLEESRDKYAALFDFAPVGYFSQGQDGRIQAINLTLCSMLGLHSKKLLGDAFAAFVAEESLAAYHRHLREAAASSGKSECEIEICTSNGERKDVLLSCTSATGVTGEGCLLIAVTDISQRKRDEDALLKSEAKFKMLSELVPVGVYLTGSQGECTYANQKWLSMAGMTLDQAFGRGWVKALHPEDRSKVFAAWEKMVASKGDWGMTYRFQSPGGETTWVHGVTAALFDDGHLLGYIGANVDITERKTLEDALKISEQRYRDVVESQSELVCRYLPDGRISFVNEAYLNYYGLERETVLGTNFVPLIPKEEQASILAGLGLLNLDDPSIRFKHRIITPEGETRWQEWSHRAFFSPGGKVVEYQAVGRDITERVQIEQALQEKTVLLDAYFMNSLDLLCIADTDGFFRKLNPEWEKTLGYSLDELEGRRYTDFVHPDDIESTKKATENLAGHNEIRGFINRYRAKDGSYRFIEWRSFPAGRITYNTARDISERKRAEMILQARLRLMQFSAMHSFEGVLIAAIDEAEILTDSQVGFYHFLNPDQKTIVLQAWSTRTTREMCRAEGKGMYYDVAKAGVWVDCILKRQTVIHDDYAALPHKKGLPPGHAPVVRELVTPVFRQGEIVALLGVGNKPIGYSTADVEAVTLLADFAWDIVERKRAENMLLESEAKYSAFFQNSIDAIMLMSLDGRIHQVNPAACRIFGWSEEEIRQGDRGMIFDESDPLIQAFLRKRDAEGHAWGELPLRCKDGSTILTETTSSIYLDSHGERKGSIIFRDITERKKNEELRDQIERIIQHDLRSPASSAVQVATLLCDEPNLTDEQHLILHKLLYSGEIMLNTLNRSLVMYKIETGKYISAPRTFDCVGLVKEMVEYLNFIPRSAVFIDVLMDGRPLAADAHSICLGEPDLLRSALHNILENALESSPPKSTVVVNLTSGEEYSIEIRNKGVVPLQIRDRFFEKYVTHGKYKGTGIGTYSAKIMIEAQGGCITMQTSDEENETVVTIHLPVQPRP